MSNVKLQKVAVCYKWKKEDEYFVASVSNSVHTLYHDYKISRVAMLLSNFGMVGSFCLCLGR